MPMDPTHGPIVADQRAMMNALAETIDRLFNGQGLPGLAPPPKKIAFVLLTAKFGDYDDGRVNYISNGERSDIIAMMKELIARFEGRVSQEIGHG
jgi:hypothetical protein